MYTDASGSNGALVVKVPSTRTVAAADVNASALASVVASLTSCNLLRQRITYTVVQSPPLTAAAGSSLKRQGAFFFSVDPPSPDGIVLIPGINDAILQTVGPCAGYCIDRSNADVITFAASLIDNGVCNPFGDAYTALIGGYLQSRT